MLDGEANLYFENAYVGTSIIGNKISDTLDISLGRDKNVLIQRRDTDTHNTKRILGSNTTLRKGYELRLRNQKSQDIQIKIFDQIPVAARNEIKIEVKDMDGATSNEETGIIYWKLNLKPGENLTKNLIYEVKYPKNEQVTLR